VPDAKLYRVIVLAAEVKVVKKTMSSNVLSVVTIFPAFIDSLQIDAPPLRATLARIGMNIW
jgi:hypothetical protein